MRFLKFVRDAALREDVGRQLSVPPSRASSPAGGGVLPPVPPAGRGARFDDALTARVSPCGNPDCACASGEAS